MQAVWVDIHEAIVHNKKVIPNNEKSMGQSIERGTFALEEVAKLISQNANNDMHVFTIMVNLMSRLLNSQLNYGYYDVVMNRNDNWYNN